MAKLVGISRSIKLEWLNQTVELLKQGMSAAEIKQALNDYLSIEIKSPTNLRKTREILMNIWVHNSSEHQSIRKNALELMGKNDTPKLAIHWCMILLRYPLFIDVCKSIGRVTNIQSTFTTSWYKQKLSDVWGERTTLIHTSDKILQTLKYTEVIENTRVGEYKVNVIDIHHESTIRLMILTYMTMNQKAYYDITELTNIPELFPFRFQISHEMLHHSDLFSMNYFGGKIVVMEQ